MTTVTLNQPTPGQNGFCSFSGSYTLDSGWTVIGIGVVCKGPQNYSWQQTDNGGTFAGNGGPMVPGTYTCQAVLTQRKGSSTLQVNSNTQSVTIP